MRWRRSGTVYINASAFKEYLQISISAVSRRTKRFAGRWLIGTSRVAGETPAFRSSIYQTLSYIASAYRPLRRVVRPRNAPRRLRRHDGDRRLSLSSTRGCLQSRKFQAAIRRRFRQRSSYPLPDVRQSACAPPSPSASAPAFRRSLSQMYRSRLPRRAGVGSFVREGADLSGDEPYSRVFFSNRFRDARLRAPPDCQRPPRGSIMAS